MANSPWFTRDSYCRYIRRRKRRANRLESRIIYRKGWSGWHVMWMHWPSSHVFPILSSSFHPPPPLHVERMSVTLIPTTFVAIKLGHPIFPTVFDLQPTPSGPLRRRNALFHRANLRPTHNASLCSVYPVFQVFARKSLVRSFGYVFIRVREFVLSLNRDPSCSIEKLSVVKSFIVYVWHVRFATIVKKYS